MQFLPLVRARAAHNGEPVIEAALKQAVEKRFYVWWRRSRFADFMLDAGKTRPLSGCLAGRTWLLPSGLVVNTGPDDTSVSTSPVLRKILLQDEDARLGMHRIIRPAEFVADLARGSIGSSE